MHPRSGFAGTVVTALLIAGLTACGGGDDKTPTAAVSDDGGPPVPDASSSVSIQKPDAERTIEPTATETAVPGVEMLDGGPEQPHTINGFPIPDGVKVKGPGAADETWQFDIPTKKPQDVIDFYVRVLPQMGYRVRTDVTYTLGTEQVHWDIAFDGPVSGSMERDPDNGVVFVVINPPGQPAFPGDDPQG